MLYNNNNTINNNTGSFAKWISKSDSIASMDAQSGIAVAKSEGVSIISHVVDSHAIVTQVILSLLWTFIHFIYISRGAKYHLVYIYKVTCYCFHSIYYFFYILFVIIKFYFLIFSIPAAKCKTNKSHRTVYSG